MSFFDHVPTESTTSAMAFLPVERISSSSLVGSSIRGLRLVAKRTPWSPILSRARLIPLHLEISHRFIPMRREIVMSFWWMFT